MFSRGTGSVNQFVEYFRFDGFSRSSYFFDASSPIQSWGWEIGGEVGGCSVGLGVKITLAPSSNFADSIFGNGTET